MAIITLVESMRCRHRGLQTRMAALELDARARRPRVVQLAEELVAHATAEQLVLYPFAEELLGVHDLSVDIEQSLEALLCVVGDVERDSEFSIAMARLSAVFERHVRSDETGLLPMVQALGPPDEIRRVELTIEEFERALSSPGGEGGIGFWPEAAGQTMARNGGRPN